MREVEIKLMGQYYLNNAVIEVNGEPVKFKNNKFGNLVCNYQTESDRLSVKIYRLLDVGGFFWFLTQLLFFVVSVFGILDIHRKERCLVLDFQADFDLQDVNNLTLQINTPKENEKAVKVQTDLTYNEVLNEYYLDVKAKKKLKALTVTKLIFALAIIAAVVTVLIIKL